MSHSESKIDKKTEELIDVSILSGLFSQDIRDGISIKCSWGTYQIFDRHQVAVIENVQQIETIYESQWDESSRTFQTLQRPKDMGIPSNCLIRDRESEWYVKTAAPLTTKKIAFIREFVIKNGTKILLLRNLQLDESSIDLLTKLLNSQTTIETIWIQNNYACYTKNYENKAIIQDEIDIITEKLNSNLAKNTKFKQIQIDPKDYSKRIYWKNQNYSNSILNYKNILVATGILLAGAVAAGLFFTKLASLPLALGIGGSIILLTLIARKAANYREAKNLYKAFTASLDEKPDINSTKEKVKSYNLGFEAESSWLAYFSSCLSPAPYRESNAYYTGKSHALNNKRIQL